MSTYYVPSPVPNDEIRSDSSWISELPKPTGCWGKGTGKLNSLPLEDMLVLGATGCVCGWGWLLLAGHRLTQVVVAGMDHRPAVGGSTRCKAC